MIFYLGPGSLTSGSSVRREESCSTLTLKFHNDRTHVCAFTAAQHHLPTDLVQIGEGDVATLIQYHSSIHRAGSPLGNPRLYVLVVWNHLSAWPTQLTRVCLYVLIVIPPSFGWKYDGGGYCFSSMCKARSLMGVCGTSGLDNCQ